MDARPASHRLRLVFHSAVRPDASSEPKDNRGGPPAQANTVQLGDETRELRLRSDQLVIACGLYFPLPFGQMHHRNPKIIEVARLLKRTPSSLAMKLVNFASDRTS